MKYLPSDLRTIAGTILRSNRFMTLATVSSLNEPWVSPLAFGCDDADHFFWVSACDCVHSRNLASNPTVAIVIFDADPQPGLARALYARGRAQMLSGDELALGCDLYYKKRYPDPIERGLKASRLDDLSGDMPRRMYRATVEEYSLLHPEKHPIHGPSVDHRVRIEFSSAQAWPVLPPSLLSARSLRLRTLMWRKPDRAHRGDPR